MLAAGPAQVLLGGVQGKLSILRTERCDGQRIGPSLARNRLSWYLGMSSAPDPGGSIPWSPMGGARNLGVWGHERTATIAERW